MKTKTNIRKNRVSPKTSSNPSWNNNDGKLLLYRGLMQHFRDNSADRDRCLDYEAGRAIAEQVAASTGITIPPDAKVVFLPENDWSQGDSSTTPQTRNIGGLDYHAGSSMIVTLPPKKTTGDAALQYACSYIIWPPHSPPTAKSARAGAKTRSQKRK